MARLRFDAVKGALASALGSGDTTISSLGLARLGNVNSPDVALVCLYAADAAGNITTSENVYVTSHVAGTTTATVTRAGDGTTAQAWVNGSQWTHGFGVADVADVEANTGGGVTSFNTRTGSVTLSKSDVTGTGLSSSDVGALGATAAAGGDLTGSYPNPTLAAAGSAGTYGAQTAIPVITTDSKGRVTSVSTQAPRDSTKLPTAGGTMSGALAMGSNKITGLANGSASDDAAAFGQIPTTLPPTTHASTHASGGSDPVTIAESQVTGLTTDLAAKAPLTNSGISYVSGASPANTRRSTLSFGASVGALTSGWQDICSRVSFTLPVTPTRCRLRITNSNVLTGTTTSQSVAITGVYWGTPAGSEATWAGDFAATPTTIAGLNTTQDLSTELVTSWFTPPASAVANAFQAISIGYTVANDSKVNLVAAPGWTWHGATGVGCSTAAGNAAAPGVGTSSPRLLPFDVRMEFEYVGSNEIGLFIGDSLYLGFISAYGTASAVGKMGVDDSWPQMAANRMGALAINAGVNSAKTSDFTSSSSLAWTRFDLATCVPDFAVIGLGINEIQNTQYFPDYQSRILTIIANCKAAGIKRIYLTTISPYTAPASSVQATQAGIIKTGQGPGSLGSVTIVGPVTSTTPQGGVPGGGNPGIPTDWYQSSALFTVANCTNTNGSTTVTTSNNFKTAGGGVGVYVGQIVTGTGIPAGTTVRSVDSTTQITLSQNATGGSGVTLTFNFNTCYFELPATTVMEGPFAITAASGTTTLSLTVAGTLVNSHNAGVLIFTGTEGIRQKINDWILSGVPGATGAVDFADISQLQGGPQTVAVGNPSVPFSTQNWKFFPVGSNAHPTTPALYARWAQAFASSVLGQ